MATLTEFDQNVVERIKEQIAFNPNYVIEDF